MNNKAAVKPMKAINNEHTKASQLPKRLKILNFLLTATITTSNFKKKKLQPQNFSILAPITYLNNAICT